MKFVIALAALIVVAYAHPMADPKDGDFRNEFDRLIVAEAVTKFREMEKFLLHLAEQVAEFEKKPTKEEKQRILREITVVEAFTQGSKGFFERELKRTDLDLLEKFNFEAVLKTIEILHKDLTALATRVTKVQV